MFYHNPIQIKNLSFALPHKLCFENFSTKIHYGERIAIIGRNGIGKSILLKAIQKQTDLIEGSVHLPNEICFGYTPQLPEKINPLSGGEQFNKNLTTALSLNPNVLLLDEPTNHLDYSNRKALMRMLKNYSGTLILVSHDVELLRVCIDKLWHIDNGQIKIFSGNYDHYLDEIKLKRLSIEKKLSSLAQEKKNTHHLLMKEQVRAKKSKLYGERKVAEGSWSSMLGNAKKTQAQFTAGKKKKEIGEKKQELIEELSSLRLPEVIIPKFSLNSKKIKHKTIVSIAKGSIGYTSIILKNIYLTLMSDERIVIDGNNGSGKSTLIQGILCAPGLIKSGIWDTPKRETIGYLDQHYADLDPTKNVYQTINELTPNWTQGQVRKHLNDFLFRKNEEIESSVSILSGGEKARLSLAKIALTTPQLLILDEITNNVDLETREHIIQVLSNYPNAMLIISHDKDFLERIGIDKVYNINLSTQSIEDYSKP